MTKAQQKLESKGFKIVHCMGYRNGMQCITGVIAKKNGQTYSGTSCTDLAKRLIHA